MGRSRPQAELRADLERRVIAILAGSLAERWLGDRHQTNGFRETDPAEDIAREALATLGPRLLELVVAREESPEERVGDEANARDFAGAFAGAAAAPMYLDWLRAIAQELVERFAPALIRVADALERRAVLSGDAIAALIRDTPEPD